MTDQLNQPQSHAPTRQKFVTALVQSGFGPTTADGIAATAERVGIVWRPEPQPSQPASRVEHFSRFNFPTTPIVAEIRDPTGARQVVHALEERVKDEIRKLIQDEISAFNRQSLAPRLENVDSRTEAAIESANSAHTFLRGHDTRITALERQTAGLETHRDWVLGTLTVRVTELGARLAELQTAVGVDLGNFDPYDDETISERLSDLVARVESEWQIEGQKLAADRRQLREFVVDTVSRTDAELACIKSLIDAPPANLKSRVDTMWRRLYENFDGGTATEFGLLELIRRLDTDVALLRDAAVLPPPQGANRDDPYWNADAELVKAMHDQYRAELQTLESATEPAIEWPDPTPAMLESSVFEAVWQVIRTWDIAVPGAYTGYTSATGNHVRAILDVLSAGRHGFARVLGQKCEHLRQTREALRAACTELGADSQWSDETSLADVVSKVLMPAVARRIADEIG